MDLTEQLLRIEQGFSKYVLKEIVHIPLFLTPVGIQTSTHMTGNAHRCAHKYAHIL